MILVILLAIIATIGLILSCIRFIFSCSEFECETVKAKYFWDTFPGMRMLRRVISLLLCLGVYYIYGLRDGNFEIIYVFFLFMAVILCLYNTNVEEGVNGVSVRVLLFMVISFALISLFSFVLLLFRDPSDIMINFGGLSVNGWGKQFLITTAGLLVLKIYPAKEIEKNDDSLKKCKIFADEVKIISLRSKLAGVLCLILLGMFWQVATGGVLFFSLVVWMLLMSLHSRRNNLSADVICVSLVVVLSYMFIVVACIDAKEHGQITTEVNLLFSMLNYSQCLYAIMIIDALIWMICPGFRESMRLDDK